MLNLFIAAEQAAPAAAKGSECAAQVSTAGPNPTSIEKGAKAAASLTKQLCAWFDAEKSHLLAAAIVAAAAIVIAFLVWLIVAKLIRRAAGRFSPLSGEIVGSLGAPAAWCTIFAGLSWANQMVDFPGNADLLIDKVFYGLFIIVFVWGAMRVVGVCDEYFAAKRAKTANAGMERLIGDLIRRAAKTMVWFIALIFVIQNIFHFNVTALLTGAGVAGLAIAFAAQNTIANIFGALSIVSDKIFKIGDFIDVGGKRGTVEEVGFRSTKLRSLDGTLWNLPNRLVADAAIENISARKNIKFPFTLSLVYSTTPGQMQQALDILKEIFDAFTGFDKNNPPKYSFTAFNSSSLDIGVIVWFDTQNFMEAQKMKENLNLQILERFNAAGLSFAYPSVTNYVVGVK